LSLATRAIENGALRPFALSLLGHIVLAGLILFLPASRKKVYIEEIPRAVRLVATLDAPPVSAPKPRPKPVPAPKPQPKPKARPKTARPAPPPARSRVKIPVKERPPLVTPRSATPPATSLQKKLAGRLASLERKPPEPLKTGAPAVKVPAVTPLPVPITPATPTQTALREELVTVANFPHSWYIAIIKERIYSRFNPPSSFALRGRRIAAVASFRITREGRPVDISLRESSGHRLFDQSALAALENSSGLPPLPKDYKENFLDVVIRFQSQNH
jgi:TonB family protein